MPEILEVETYRRAASRCVGRVVERVVAPDGWYLKGGLIAEELVAAIQGSTIRGTGRRGKLAWLTTDEHLVGLRFGMTGRIVVDGELPIAKLEYSSGALEPRWERFGLEFRGGGRLAIVDPRRLGGIELDPNVNRLGPDALDHRWTPVRLARALTGDRAVKSALLDQARIAGLGNLLVDELLWRAGIAPTRDVRAMDSADWSRLSRWLPKVLAELGVRGGSHTGDLQSSRMRGGLCPRDGAPLRRESIGGRTTYWCSLHQV